MTLILKVGEKIMTINDSKFILTSFMQSNTGIEFIRLASEVLGNCENFIENKVI